MASMLRGTAPPLLPSRLRHQLPSAASASQTQQQRCRAERREESSIAFVERRWRQGPSISRSPLLSTAAPPPSRRPVAASASRRAAAAAAAAAAAKATPPSLFDPVAVSEALKSFFTSFPTPPFPSSLAAALAAAAALPPARRDALAALATAVGAYALVKFFDKVATKGWLDQVRRKKTSSFLPFFVLSLSLFPSLTAFPPSPTSKRPKQKLTRKLVHTLAGPLFVASWPLFSASESARLFAAGVPLLNGLRLVLAGTGITSSEGSVRSMTRHGDRKELLRGPLYYVIALVLATLTFWRLSPASACAVAAMCGGDGLADIIGRRSPPNSPRIPWNKDKTLRGSAAMFVASLAFAVALVWLFAGFGYFGVGVGGAAANVLAPSSSSASVFSSSLSSTLFASFSAQRAAASALAPPTLAALAAVALAATAVESLPANALVDDNVSVPLVAMGLGWWLFEKSC